MKNRTVAWLGAAALALLVATPGLAEEKKKEEHSAPAKSAPNWSAGGHPRTGHDHGGSPGGINPAVPAAVGGALGILGALGAFSPPPPGPPGPPGPYRPAAGPPPSSAFRYTDRPGWIGPDGHPCREYVSTQTVGGQPSAHVGNVCQAGDGVWRVVN